MLLSVGAAMLGMSYFLCPSSVSFPLPPACYPAHTLDPWPQLALPGPSLQVPRPAARADDGVVCHCQLGRVAVLPLRLKLHSIVGSLDDPRLGRFIDHPIVLFNAHSLGSDSYVSV